MKNVIDVEQQRQRKEQDVLSRDLETIEKSNLKSLVDQGMSFKLLY